MEQSRRAVESYWRSKMIDAATSDEDKVTPVYKLDEICDLLRSSHVSIVKEVSEFIIKRLEHKSPIVKQKALRVVKYTLGKSSAEFKREMQRNSASIRQLIHYKGQPDPLKGEALNKAVRETAKEALSVLFSSDDSAVAPTESSLRSRIQGFGNSNYEVPLEDKRSFISEVVDFGSATIKQGLSSLAHSSTLRNDGDGGSYKSPYLQRSLTKESDYSDHHEGFNSERRLDASRYSEKAGSSLSGPNISTYQSEVFGENSSLVSEHKSREEKTLETIVTSAGVRLQPTRDALNAFIVEASKLNSLQLSYAIQSKLQSPQWQIRMRALCVLEAILRKKEDRNLSTIASYFGENKDPVSQCLESPQASLREKAVKVLNILNGGQVGGVNQVVKANSQPTIVPDLIDTGDTDEIGLECLKETEVESMKNEASFPAPLIDDLLGDHFESTSGNKIEDDPFSDVSFLNSQDKGLPGGIVGDNLGSSEAFTSSSQATYEPFGISSVGSQVFNDKTNNMAEAAFLIDGLSINGNDPSEKNTKNRDKSHVDSVINVYAENRVSSSNVFNSEVASQAAGMNANSMYPIGSMPGNFHSGMGMNLTLGSQHMNYSALGTLYAQQQFLVAMANFHQAGTLQPDAASSGVGTNSSPLPDIFNPGTAIQPPTSLSNGSKRDETKAFDFISSHLASARDAKRMI